MPIRNLIFRGFLFAIISLTLFNTYKVGRDSFMAQESPEWTKISGVVVSTADFDTPKIRRDIKRDALIRHSYRAGGTLFEGTTISFSRRKCRYEKEAKAFAAKHPAGSSIDVHVNPKTPSESVLQPGGSNWDNSVFMMAGILVAGALGWVLVKVKLEGDGRAEILDQVPQARE